MSESVGGARAGGSGSEAPLHGYQGDRGAAPRRAGPGGPCVALSRESGARGGTIGRRVGQALKWQVYDQELLEYVAQDAVARQALLDQLAPDGRDWVEGRLEALLGERNLTQHQSVIQLARVVLAVGAQGEAVLIGRGAGCILPRESTLHVRLIAPVEERVAYVSQWMRLTLDDARERVRLRDARRSEFVSTHFHRHPGEVHQYDLLLNSALLGEEGCVELIVHAARTRAARVRGQ